MEFPGSPIVLSYTAIVFHGRIVAFDRSHVLIYRDFHSRARKKALWPSTRCSHIVIAQVCPSGLAPMSCDIDIIMLYNIIILIRRHRVSSCRQRLPLDCSLHFFRSSRVLPRGNQLLRFTISNLRYPRVQWRSTMIPRRIQECIKVGERGFSKWSTAKFSLSCLYTYYIDHDCLKTWKILLMISTLLLLCLMFINYHTNCVWKLVVAKALYTRLTDARSN